MLSISVNVGSLVFVYYGCMSVSVFCLYLYCSCVAVLFKRVHVTTTCVHVAMSVASFVYVAMNWCSIS